ncbi:hypothetical protein ACH5RR_001645 [Cinchona calisaya]|uniref:F-box associated beta-propeller type 1 domain-containing protein n=1 Tax=Cinchona calisaya TaxID=153742 RepID=A0ABD3B591_9GENT
MACNIKEETVILSFDFNQEVFKEIALPNYENGKQEVVKFVGAFKGSLSVFISSPLSRTKRGSKYFDLWVMKDYGVVDSWTKMFTIKIDGGISRIFTFTKYDAEIVLQDKKKNVLVYNIDAGTIKYLETEEDPTNQELKLVTSENSLVLIEEQNEQFDHWEYYNPRIVEEDTDEEGMSYY